MNTTAAAIQAGVTTATIRTWCRRGAVAAVKAAGRWVIDATSLAHRIAIGQQRKARVTDTPKYRIEEGTAVHYGETRTVYTIVRTDGTPAGYGKGKDHRIHGARFFSLESAEIYAKFYEQTPDGFHLERRHYPSRGMRSGSYWRVTGCTDGDTDMSHDWPDRQEVADNWPEGTTWLDVLISIANRHADGAADRIAKRAQQAAIDAAEATVRAAREEQLAEARRAKGELATSRQIDYILQLLSARQRTGEGGGFFCGPTDRAGIELMSKADASNYINSLKGTY